MMGAPLVQNVTPEAVRVAGEVVFHFYFCLSDGAVDFAAEITLVCFYVALLLGRALWIPNKTWL